MSTLERYEVDQSPAGITITLNQKKNAAVNMVIGLGIVGVAMYLLMTSNDRSAVHYVVAGVGVLWLIGGVAGFRQKRCYRLTTERIEYQTSARSQAHSMFASYLSRVLLQKIVRPTGGRKRKVPFPWRVKLIDHQDKAFRGEFRFQEGQSADELASMIAGFYSVQVLKEEK